MGCVSTKEEDVIPHRESRPLPPPLGEGKATRTLGEGKVRAGSLGEGKEAGVPHAPRTGDVIHDTLSREQAENILAGYTLESTREFSLEGRNIYAKVLKVYDVDTITVAFFFQGDVYKKSCRLLGIDGAEMRTKNREEKEYAIRSREYLSALILGKILFLHFKNWDLYGRPLIDVYMEQGDKQSINSHLLERGWAYPYDGKKKRKYEEWEDIRRKNAH